MFKFLVVDQMDLIWRIALMNSWVIQRAPKKTVPAINVGAAPCFVLGRTGPSLRRSKNPRLKVYTLW